MSKVAEDLEKLTHKPEELKAMENPEWITIDSIVPSSRLHTSAFVKNFSWIPYKFACRSYPAEYGDAKVGIGLLVTISTTGFKISAILASINLRISCSIIFIRNIFSYKRN